LKDLDDGVIGISKNMRVSAWANQWLETYKKPSITKKNYKNYKRYVDNIIVPQIGGLRLHEVTDVHLQRLMNSRERCKLHRTTVLKPMAPGVKK